MISVVSPLQVYQPKYYILTYAFRACCIVYHMVMHELTVLIVLVLCEEYKLWVDERVGGRVGGWVDDWCTIH